MKKLLLLVVILCIAGIWIKKKDMTLRQSILRAAYPLIMLKSKLFPENDAVRTNSGGIQPPVSFYELTATANNGSTIRFDTFKGKKVLIVNTASDCGYTAQYNELEQLHQRYSNLVILGFPANDFKQQEKSDDAAIAQFCKLNFGVSFPLMQKTQVIKGAGQNAVFSWLSQAGKNGWCNEPPSWNFSKYLVDEQGRLVAFFKQTVSPLDKRLTGWLP